MAVEELCYLMVHTCMVKCEIKVAGHGLTGLTIVLLEYCSRY